MGSYAYLRLGKLVLASTKREVDPSIMMLFTEDDKKTIELTSTEVAEIYEDEEGEYDPATAYEYKASLTIVKDRLEFMGFTLPFVQKEFASGVEESLSELAEQRENAGLRNIEGYLQRSELEEDLLRSITFDAWLEAVKYIVDNGLRPYDFRRWPDPDEAHKDVPSLVTYILSEGHGEGVWFPSYDFRSFMRGLVEVAGTNADIVYDLTDLVLAEEIDATEDLCTWARWQMADEFVLNHKIVILTEGITDKVAIEGALRLLYPHLASYYSFMDFEGVKVPGGAGVLVNTLKAFMGAGIVNRIIALFDNDTAARSAVRSLSAIPIPDNVRVLHFPEVLWAENYPTLGPQGLSEMNVNGLAGGIEMYYGVDVLRQQDGSLTPVQWRGYEDGLRQYQGELSNKGDLQKRYMEKLRKCQDKPDLLEQHDWSGMFAILETLRTAFH